MRRYETDGNSTAGQTERPNELRPAQLPIELGFVSKPPTPSVFGRAKLLLSRRFQEQFGSAGASPSLLRHSLASRKGRILSDSIVPIAVVVAILALVCFSLLIQGPFQGSAGIHQDRQEVVFWHFWGGRDRTVVDGVVARFNASQRNYHVRAIAVPGNNLQAKLFLSVTGGDPPDLVNQDDPILADWSMRGIIMPLDEIADPTEVNKVRDWMFDSARQLSEFEGRMYAVCNGLDIRALYYNKTLLDQFGLDPPRTIADLDRIAATISPMTRDSDEANSYFGFLPDTRRLWDWGFVFGGNFYDFRSETVTANSPEIVAALDWMASYSRRYGADNVASFRQADQSLPGKSFPLLPVQAESTVGRYAMIMDGQWRVRDISQFCSARRKADGPPATEMQGRTDWQSVPRAPENADGPPVPEFGVCPLPYPEGGRSDAGCVNGNFFVVPRGSKNPRGAWEFMKFWIGYADAAEGARTCAEGGWIPVSQVVTDHPVFQEHLRREPLFSQFVRLAASRNQFTTPQIPGAAMFRRTVELAGYEAMAYPERSASEILHRAQQQIQQQLDRIGEDRID